MKSDNKLEKLPIVDSEGNVISSATREECHIGTKYLHPVVHLHVFDTAGRIYLQKRPLWKDIQPGKWDTAVGGHVGYGEEIATALEREAQEEIGVKVTEPTFLLRYLFESEREKELVYVYKVDYDGEVCPSDELDGGRFWEIAEVRSAMGKGILTPNFEHEIAMVMSLLKL
ncbi:MAG: NUDIX domain-containing protein [Bacteroidaceae bacterium]|nr:NUDIX domain-containing protein [Bacteroidaceae bacterium]